MDKIETVQIINESNYPRPLRVILLFIKDNSLLEQIGNLQLKDWEDIITNKLDIFLQNIKIHLNTNPIILSVMQNQISRTILVHHNRKFILGICVLVVSFDGSYIKTFIITPPKYNFTNLLISIGKNDILIKKGMLSKEQQKLIKKRLLS